MLKVLEQTPSEQLDPKLEVSITRLLCLTSFKNTSFLQKRKKPQLLHQHSATPHLHCDPTRRLRLELGYHVTGPLLNMPVLDVVLVIIADTVYPQFVPSKL
jgi:hypothetical protein